MVRGVLFVAQIVLKYARHIECSCSTRRQIVLSQRFCSLDRHRDRVNESKPRKRVE